MAAYWVVRVNALGAKKFEVYAPLAAEAVAAHGGRYLARAARTKQPKAGTMGVM